MTKVITDEFLNDEDTQLIVEDLNAEERLSLLAPVNLDEGCYIMGAAGDELQPDIEMGFMLIHMNQYWFTASLPVMQGSNDVEKITNPRGWVPLSDPNSFYGLKPCSFRLLQVKRH